ncbi:hypothetical protein [Streptomyces lavendulae]|uniref:hypothetical protein n=1 Tax=Streptomyces lavendulae TaxID=1914 RepID=UPI0004BF5A13|nr:hypothetical protein [Streptomyces lavendulae]
MRRGRGRWVPAVLVMAAATACGAPLQDLGPLPPRYSGPPLAADEAVADLTAAMAEEGVTVRRMPQNMSPIECHETLGAEYPSATADAALRSGFARARSGHGWKESQAPAEGMLGLRKANWTATTELTGSAAAEFPTAQVVITLLCDGAHSKPQAPATPSAGSPTAR